MIRFILVVLICPALPDRRYPDPADRMAHRENKSPCQRHQLPSHGSGYFQIYFVGNRCEDRLYWS